MHPKNIPQQIMAFPQPPQDVIGGCVRLMWRVEVCGLVENCQLVNNEANARSQLSTDCYSWPGTDRPPCDTNLHTKMSISTYLSQKLGTNLAKSCRIQTGFGLYMMIEGICPQLFLQLC